MLRPERDKPVRRRSTTLTIPLYSNSRPVQFVTCDRQPLSTAQFCRAGLFATADTCLAYI